MTSGYSRKRGKHAEVHDQRKHIRCANRNSDSRYVTVTLVEHGTGVVKASTTNYDAGGELDATRKPLSEVDIAGSVVTLDVRHAGSEV